MKYYTLLALLGLTTSLKLERHHHDHAAVDLGFRPNPVQSPWADKSKAPPGNKISGGYTPYESGSVYYARETPDRFSGEEDDRLMWSVIK